MAAQIAITIVDQYMTRSVALGDCFTLGVPTPSLSGTCSKGVYFEDFRALIRDCRNGMRGEEERKVML
jgi:hypothetical protein